MDLSAPDLFRLADELRAAAVTLELTAAELGPFAQLHCPDYSQAVQLWRLLLEPAR